MVCVHRIAARSYRLFEPDSNLVANQVREMSGFEPDLAPNLVRADRCERYRAAIISGDDGLPVVQASVPFQYETARTRIAAHANHGSTADHLPLKRERPAQEAQYYIPAFLTHGLGSPPRAVRDD